MPLSHRRRIDVCNPPNLERASDAQIFARRIAVLKFHVEFKAVLVVVLCLVMTALPFMAPSPAYAEAPGPTNLLVDGDFEAPSPWPWQDGIGEVQVGPGWRAWYLDVAPDYVQTPVNCGDSKVGYHCYWMRPEFRDNIAASFANRVHSGFRSQKYFSYGRMHEAGLYQRVGGIRPGSTVRFSIYIQAWMCHDIDKCGMNGIRSDAPSDMHLRVGIDPYGGDNPFSPNVVWAPEKEAFDRWVEFAVETPARADTVTVFTHSRPDWPWARVSNDVYLDDASLVVVSPTYMPAGVAKPVVSRSGVTTTLKSTITSTLASPVATASDVSAAANMKNTYTVVLGDTLYKIAAHFNTTVAALALANKLTNINLIFLGSTLLVP
jgi:LysM repeat protein